ncbi:MAG: helix-turn-helix domain-containing protein [Desulfovibrio sp.]|nr:helix-turn-helix domain-containing protein [Desulfovibrio sp.]
MTGISLSTLRKYRLWGKGPTYSKIGRSVRYALADVLEYMESRRIQLRG